MCYLLATSAEHFTRYHLIWSSQESSMGLLAFLLLGFPFYRWGNPDTLKGRCVGGSSRICVHAATSAGAHRGVLSDWESVGVSQPGAEPPQDVLLDPLENSTLRDNSQGEVTPVGPHVDLLGPKTREDGNRACYQLLLRRCRPRGTTWWCILDLLLFSSKPLFCQTLEALLVQWL